MVSAKPLPTIRCPRCKCPMAVDEVLFVSDYTVVINGTCPKCGASLTSGNMNALELFPSKEGERGN